MFQKHRTALKKMEVGAGGETWAAGGRVKNNMIKMTRRRALCYSTK